MDSSRERSPGSENEELRAKRKGRQAEPNPKETSPDAIHQLGIEAPALTDPRFSPPANLGRKAQTMLDLQRSRGNAYVQRLMAHDREPLNRESEGRAKQIESAKHHAPSRNLVPFGSHEASAPSLDDVRRSVDRSRALSGSGTPLSEEQRAGMETSLGLDLGGVRIHADTEAQNLTGILGAEAATIGQDIYINPEAHGPGSAGWQHLIGHEVTHVAQTRGREGQGPLVSSPTDESERQAEQGAEAIARGEPVLVGGGVVSPRIQLYRPLANDAQARVFPSPLDPAPITEWCSAIANAGTPGVWDGTPLQGEIERVFRSAYFLSPGNTAWSSREYLVERGWGELDYKVQVDISLWEDDAPEELGAGAVSTVSTTSTATAGTAGSTGQTSGLSGGASGGSKDTAGVNVGGSAERRAGQEGSLQTGGQVGGQSQSTTRRFRSTVYATARIRMQAVSWLQNFPARSFTSGQYTVGTTEYTRPTLEAPPAAPAGTPR